METTVSDDSATEAAAMLAASGLSPAPDEAAMMCAVYPGFRAAIDALYDVAAARYADPALRFRAADTGHADWAP
ncbi:MAG: hypothetical protein QOG28_3973 [Trebonia sp.]|jgi:hypothetical protein|nr:hypothetical protein [Trebonia sp.]